jgi:hypothetical protein
MSAGLAFRLATSADNADILRLLRENGMAGRYSLSLEREPDAFAAPAPRDRHAYVLAIAPGGESVGLCERVVRPAFVNGRVERLPYLTALRVAKSHRNRIAVLKGGFHTLHEQVEQPDEFPAALTSIAADNAVARRVLTAGLKGLPSYSPIGGYSTLVLRPRRFAPDPALSLARPEELGEVAAFLRQELVRFQFAPVWTEAALRSLSASFLVHRTAGRITGCLSLWDQRALRQAVVRGYPPAVRALRPAINLVAPALGIPTLPHVGTALSQAFLSHLAVAQDDPDIMLSLVRAGLTLAARQGLRAAVVGMSSAHAFRGTLLGGFRAVEYETLLYWVHWPEGAAAAAASDARLPMPEVGLL